MHRQHINGAAKNSPADALEFGAQIPLGRAETHEQCKQTHQHQDDTDGTAKVEHEIAVVDDPGPAEALVENIPQHDTQDQRRHRVFHLAQDKPENTEQDHGPDVEHALLDGVTANDAEHEDHRHQPFARHRQDLQQHGRQQDAEKENCDGGEQHHHHHLIHETGEFEHDHRAGSHPMQNHRRQQHGSRGRAGNAQGQHRNEGARRGGAVTGFRGDQALCRALAELFLFLAGAARRRIGHPGPDILADTGDNADQGAQDARPDNGAAVFKDMAGIGKHVQQPGLCLHNLSPAIVHHRNNLRETEGADHGRDQVDARLHFGETEGKAVGHIEAFLADHGHGQAEESGDPALQRIVDGRQLAGNKNAEDGQPEEFMGLELQGVIGQDRGDGGQEEHADDGAEEGTRRRHAHGRSGLSGHGQRITVHRRCRIGRGARYIEQDGAAAAAVNSPDIKADEDHQGVVGFHAVGQRRQQRHPHGRRQPRQHADGNTQQGSGHHEQHHCRIGKLDDGDADKTPRGHEIIE